MNATEPESSELPDAVSAYLAAKSNTDPEAIARLFTEAAFVDDNGEELRGRTEIARWRREVSTAFTFTATLLDASSNGPRVSVTERLEGDFPGGRVDLTSTFDLGADGLIQRLIIRVA